MSIRKPRKYCGHKIKGEGWAPKIRLGKWIIYVGPTIKEWVNIKVVYSGMVKYKANYWLAWNGQRLSNVLDTRIMQMRNPQLFDAVVGALKTYCANGQNKASSDEVPLPAA